MIDAVGTPRCGVRELSYINATAHRTAQRAVPTIE
jgi:hypothetical protein